MCKIPSFLPVVLLLNICSASAQDKLVLKELPSKASCPCACASWDQPIFYRYPKEIERHPELIEKLEVSAKKIAASLNDNGCIANASATTQARNTGDGQSVYSVSIASTNCREGWESRACPSGQVKITIPLETGKNMILCKDNSNVEQSRMKPNAREVVK